MLTRQRLIELFTLAGENGWHMDDGKFPAEIKGDICPKEDNIFKALELIAIKEVKFVILGQDPYFTNRIDTMEPMATGLAFAVDTDYPKTPTSLHNISKFLLPNEEKNLINWAQTKGVLLLNAALTVPLLQEGENADSVVGRHLRDWEEFTKCIIRQVKSENPQAQIIAWGSKARDILDNAFRQFVWCKHPRLSAGDDNSFRAFCEGEIGRQLKS